MSTIELRGVKKSYGRTQVVHGIDLEVAKGEFIVILGPSGCGKSTLLRMVAGLEVISEGEILIGGRVVNNLEPAERDIAMVFQNYALYPHMTVERNMAYGLRIAGLPKAEIDSRVRRTAEMLELTQLLERRPRELSGGQRQRVAMGRAIIREPQVFLFDEPLSNLDARLRVQTRLEIHRLQQQTGITSLYVTHDQVEAMTLGHRIVVMNNGIAEQVGTPAEIYERPATSFVAGFIGAPPMSLLPATVAENPARAEVAASFSLPLPATGRPGQQIQVGIRPENIRPCNADEGPALTVEHLEVLGADQIVHLVRDGARLSMRLPRHSHVSTGESISITVPAEAVAMFDRESGRAI